MRHEYRISEINCLGIQYYKVQIRKWYWPFWVYLDWVDYFAFSDISKIELKELVFQNIEEAKAFALDFAIRGKEAFVARRFDHKNQKFYIGRLP